MKSFNLEYNGKTYICELNRRIAKKLESEGLLSIGDNKTINMVDGLFYGSLLKNQPEVTYEFACTMLDDLTALDDNGECEYAYTDITNALTEMLKNTFGDGAKAKKSIR